MLNFFESKSGDISVSFDGNLIHSSVNPRMEAVKYLKKMISDEDTSPAAVLLITPGLNYLYEELLKVFPDSKYIILHSDAELFRHAESKYNTGNIYPWYYGSETDLRVFIHSVLREIDVKGLKIFHWAPAARAFQKRFFYIESTVGEIIKEYNGNINTTNYFGKRYFRNIVSNLLSINSYIPPLKIKKPVLIAASGPSLKYSASLIKKYRKNIFLVSLSSSFRFLSENSIKPDLLLTTDPGFYSTYHLKLLRSNVTSLASPLTAYHIPCHSSNPGIVINQNTMPEKIFLSNLPIEPIDIPSNGTVSGSALLLSAKLSEYPVFFTGLDFCTEDIISHCLPNEFDIYSFIESSKTSPALNKLYTGFTETYTLPAGSGKEKTTIQLKTYSEWFNSFKPLNPVYRIEPSSVDLKCFNNISLKTADSMLSGLKNSGTSEKGKSVAVDRHYVREGIKKTLRENISLLDKRKKMPLDKGNFDLFLSDILYYYSASGYLDLFSRYSAGDVISANRKYLELIESSIYFFDRLNRNIDNYG